MNEEITIRVIREPKRPICLSIDPLVLDKVRNAVPDINISYMTEQMLDALANDAAFLEGKKSKVTVSIQLVKNEK